MKTIKAFTSLLAAATLALSACGAGDSAAVVVGASPVPHAQILKYVKENLAKKAGIEIEIKEYQDYNVPNSALKDGDIDANFFQHLPYLKEASSSKGYKFNHGTGVHIEPYGIYSKNIKDLKKLPKNAQVAITDDPSNQARALELLAKNGIITLPKDKKATIYNVEKNPKNISVDSEDPPGRRHRDHQRELRSGERPETFEGRHLPRVGRGQPLRQHPRVELGGLRQEGSLHQEARRAPPLPPSRCLHQEDVAERRGHPSLLGGGRGDGAGGALLSAPSISRLGLRPPRSRS